ncbi:MAG: TonB-dependent receptor [Brevundimonas sp.]|uniref:TonB-dependent receptor n=1 Tax=Brevundimonas sp. TaxID=1871086 RepID=UPI00260513EF|nr:TonB-dependent receptor [Brevundimonas sp.]MDI6624342.1 TonB-dependent receptor [Brevundimonas sp.]MDQ7811742.1 TonB-dependent receptor [Brevundimonas sp.]
MTHNLLASASLVSLLIALPAMAQDAEPAALEEVVVTAARTQLPRSAMPSTVEVIGEAEIAQQTALGSSAVETVATLIPSFSPTRQKLSGAGETLRGRSPLFLVDGVPQSTPLRDDSRDGFTIDPFFIDRVEVIFGSNAIQGVGATGGVVNYVTAAPPAEGAGPSGRVQAATTFDDGEFGDSVGGKLAGIIGQDFGRFDLTVGAAYEARGAYYDGGGRRIGVDGTQGELQDSLSWSLFTKAGFDLTPDRRLELMINHFELEGDGDYVMLPGDRDIGLPTTSVRGVAPGVQPSNDVSSAALSYTDADVLGGTLRAQLFAHDYAGVFGGGTFGTFQDPAIAPIGTLYDQSANNSEKLGFKLDWQGDIAPLPGLSALVGVDALRDTTWQGLILTGRDWVPETRYESLAPFVQLNQRLFDGRLNLSGGLRYETVTLIVDDFETLWSYNGGQQVDGGEPGFEELLSNVGATFEVVPGLKAYGSFAQGFSMADVGRVLRGIDDPGQDVDTFLDISPVITDNYEIGLEYRRGGFDASIAAFRSETDKGARLVLVNGVFEVAREATEIEGVEVSARYAVSDTVRLGGAYASLEGRSDTDDDGAVDEDLDGANISPDRLILWAETDLTEALSLRLQAGRYFERSFDGQPAANDFEGYDLVDAVAVWRAGFGDVSLGVQNLLDEDYISYNSDTTRPTDDKSYFAGRGRTVTLGVTRRF